MVILYEVVVILGFAAIILFICQKFRIPTVVGFLLTGMIIGPHGLGVIHEIKHVEELAEIGVILLLFTIGMEFSFKNLLSLKRQALIGGTLQLGLTAVATVPVVMYFSQPFGASLFLGFLIALSSTAIVLKLLQKRAEIDSPQGRTVLAILIFQDIAVVPIMLFIPLIAGATADFGKTFAILLAKGVMVIFFVFLSVQYVVPRLLHQIAKTRDRELFLLSIVVLCFSIAWLTAVAGLSLALGAFLAGLIISESEYSYQAVANILPFRDVFTSFFFVSIGMLLNLNFAFHHIVMITMAASGVIIIKTVIVIFIVLLLGFPFRTSILSGLAICQVGEFSFVLYKASMEYNILSLELYQLFLSVSILTMVVTPFIIAAGSMIADIFLRLPIPEKLKKGMYYVPTAENHDSFSNLNNHLIIIGFGLNGQYLAKAAKIWRIPYIIIETNPETVRKEKEKGEPIFYGDAVNDAILEHAHIAEAKLAAIAISDPVSVRRMTKIIRDMNSGVYIIVRTRFFQEYKALLELGANDVIPEDFETAVEILSRVLSKYFIPREEIEEFISEIRADGYEMSRKLPENAAEFCDFRLPNVEIRRFKIKEGASAGGKTLDEIGLRKNYGVTLLAVRRENQVISTPGADTRLMPDDVVLMVGRVENLSKVSGIFS